MKPLNTQERSKLFWQFFFIVFALCFLPLGIIFYAYYAAPAQISQEQQEKLNNYSEFEHRQKILENQLTSIDSNIMVLNNGNNVNLLSAEPMIAKAIVNLTMTTDTSRVVKAIGKAYTDFLNTAHNLNQCNADKAKATSDLVKAQADLKEMNSDKKTRDQIDAMSKSH